MYCAHCGAEVREDEKFCQYCGSPVEQSLDTTARQTADTIIDIPEEQPKNLKAFIKSRYCTPDVNKNNQGSWIVMAICAVLSAGAAIMNSQAPIDGILMGAIAVWLAVSKSKAAGIVACVVGVLEMILTSVMMGGFRGYLPAIAGVYALVAVLKADKQYKAFLSGQSKLQ